MSSSPPSPRFRCIIFAIGLCLLFLSAEAWMSPSSSLSSSKNAASTKFGGHKTPALFYSSEFEFGPEFEFDRSNQTDANSDFDTNTNAAPASLSSRSMPVVERLKVHGVSVSPKGFHVLLESTTSGTSPTRVNASTSTNTSTSPISVLALKMTNDPADAHATISPESLTLCQLLSGVDMAGAILPPELLGKIVACHIEDKLESLYKDEAEDDTAKSVFTPVLTPIEGRIWEYLLNQEALLREQNVWGGLDVRTSSSSSSPLSSRIQMPLVTLDQLTLVPSRSSDTQHQHQHQHQHHQWQCKLECALPEWKETLTVDVKADMLASLAYNYDPESSPLFTSIALALRYKAPIVLKPPPQQPKQDSGTDSDTDSDHDRNPQLQLQLHYWTSKDDLDREFPQRASLESLQEQSTRVSQNIEKGFEIHKLTGALQIAIDLGDTKAAHKIRAKLDEYDSMEDLPTLNSKDEDDDGDEKYRDRLDDLERNILQ